MRTMRFTDLRVWQAADALCNEVYSLTEVFPRSEEFGLKAQLRRASVSIGSNIAEGFGRWTPRDQARFYEIAKGSAEEIRNLLIVSTRRGYMKADPKIDGQVNAICGMLVNLRKAVLSKARGSL